MLCLSNYCYQGSGECTKVSQKHTHLHDKSMRSFNIESRFKNSLKEDSCCKDKSEKVNLAELCSKEICYENGNFSGAGEVNCIVYFNWGYIIKFY